MHVDEPPRVYDRVDEVMVEALLGSRPTLPQQVARQITERYDLPHEATPTRMMWYGTGPWKRSIAYRDEVPYYFSRVLRRRLSGGLLRDGLGRSFDGLRIPEVEVA